MGFLNEKMCKKIDKIIYFNYKLNSMDNKINGLMKQNEAIYNSLKAKNVTDICDLVQLTEDMTLEQKLEALTSDNNRLKELSKQNKPLPPPKAEKQVTIQQPKKDKKDEDDEEDEELNEPVKKFECITNMEDIKRSFFCCENNDYTQFNELVKAHEFRLYKVNYKYSSDKDGAPSFSAKNLVGGFIRNFDDLRKYFMICFRCIQHNTVPVTYSYPSYWILNSTDSLENIIGSLYDDFEFYEYNDKEEFYNCMYKINQDNENLITEGYVH